MPHPSSAAAVNAPQVGFHHLGNQGAERSFRPPPQFLAGLAGVANQAAHFRRAEVAGIDLHAHCAGRGVPALFRTPEPCQLISTPTSLKARSTNSRTECASPVAST